MGKFTMDLFTPGKGFFETHVTWEDFEDNMRHTLGTKASFGPNKSARDLGDGKGFMSKLLLIEADWQQRDRELPEKFILKVITPLVWLKWVSEGSDGKNNHFSEPSVMASFAEFQQKAHNAEAATYNHLAELPKGKIAVPKIYVAKMFSDCNPLKGYIIMEYIQNMEIDILANFSLREVKQILRFKAIVEASSIDVPLEHRKNFLDAPFRRMADVFLPEEEVNKAIETLHTLEDGRFADEAQRLYGIVPELLDFEWVDNLADELGMDRVLCHGDLYPMNTLWRQGENGLELAAVIDYQLAHFGCSAVDLVFVFMAFLSGEDRRAHWEELVEIFYEYVRVEIADRKMPYTLDKLKEAYKQLFPVVAIIIIPFMAPIIEILNRQEDEDHRKECMEMTLKKVKCMLEDLFHYHERNMKIRGRKSVV